MTDLDCVFCKFSRDEKVIIWQDDLFFALYDSFPVSPGHTLIIPKEHVVDVVGLSKEEWVRLGSILQAVIGVITSTDLKSVYLGMLSEATSDTSKWFLQKAIDNPRINTIPDAYNHGLNDGKEAGRTVNHLHWHIIPRYAGDMEDPRGGVRYVIPEMGNYKIPRVVTSHE